MMEKQKQEKDTTTHEVVIDGVVDFFIFMQKTKRKRKRRRWRWCRSSGGGEVERPAASRPWVNFHAGSC